MSAGNPEQKVYVYAVFSSLNFCTLLGHTPSTAGTFRKKFWKDTGNALRAFPGIPVESTAGIPQAL